MPANILENEQMQFAAMTFFARPHKGETCGSNGLPLTPNSITIYGRSQILKTIIHPNICQYVDIIRGKHERTIIVSQFSGHPLSSDEAKRILHLDDIPKIALQITKALNILHTNNIVHRNLGPENILLQSNKEIKLFNYGLYYMTGNGSLVSFPIGHLLYTAPEVYLQGPNGPFSGPKVDIWSLGIILAELSLEISLWNSLKLGQCIRKILSLLSSTSVFERIAREHNCFEKYQALPKDLKEFIESCLSIYPDQRPTTKEILNNEIFKFQMNDYPELNNKCKKLAPLTLTEVYHWWQLAGGDVYMELKKQGLIRSSPPILSLPKYILYYKDAPIKNFL